MNGINGEVLGVEAGKGLDGISNFSNRMSKEQREAVQVVSIDRGNAFQSAVFTYLPNAAITFDPFHIIKNINDALSKVRCEQWRLADKSEKKFIKNSRFLLLSSKEKLEDNSTGKKKLLGGILNFFKFGLTSAAIEGLNSRIAQISSKMRGVVNSNLLFYKLRELTSPEFLQMI